MPNRTYPAGSDPGGRVPQSFHWCDLVPREISSNHSLTQIRSRILSTTRKSPQV